MESLKFVNWLLIFLILSGWINVLKAFSNDLNVYVVPHTHLDPGWKMTYEEYYRSFVDAIYSNTIKSLIKAPLRKFVICEMAYFEPWFESQTVDVQANVKKLISTKQIEFVGGGWVQHDEAVSSAGDIFEQMNFGLDYLQSTFNVRPTVAWQIDPFGHSLLSVPLFQSLGFENVVLNRVGNSTKERLKETLSMEFKWKPMSSLDNEGIFTHVLYNHYETPSQFDFESYQVEPVSSTNIKPLSEALVSYFQKCSTVYKTSNVLFLYGNDFRYVRAENMFENMEALISHINQNHRGIRVKFSTPSDYFAAVKSDKLFRKGAFPIVEHDFLPYENSFFDIWSGFFTSRAFLKNYVREMGALLSDVERLSAYVFLVHGFEALLLNADMINSFEIQPKWLSPSRHILIENGTVRVKGNSSKRKVTVEDMLDAVRRNVYLMCHHDAVTGTAKDYVVQDYLHRLTTSNKILQSLQAYLSSFILRRQPATTPLTHSAVQHFYREKLTNMQKHELLYIRGPLEQSQKTLSGWSCFKIHVSNPVARPRAEMVRMGISFRNVIVIGPDGRNISFQLSPKFEKSVQILEILKNCQKGASCFSKMWLYFEAEVPAFGLSVYSVCGSSKGDLGSKEYESNVEFFSVDEDIISTIEKSATDCPCRIVCAHRMDSKHQSSLDNNHISLKLSHKMKGMVERVLHTNSHGRELNLELTTEFVSYNGEIPYLFGGAYKFRSNLGIFSGGIFFGIFFICVAAVLSVKFVFSFRLCGQWMTGEGSKVYNAVRKSQYHLPKPAISPSEQKPPLDNRISEFHKGLKASCGVASVVHLVFMIGLFLGTYALRFQVKNECTFSVVSLICCFVCGHWLFGSYSLAEMQMGVLLWCICYVNIWLTGVVDLWVCLIVCGVALIIVVSGLQVSRRWFPLSVRENTLRMRTGLVLWLSASAYLIGFFYFQHMHGDIVPLTSLKTFAVVKGPLVEEVHYFYEDFPSTSFSLRLFKNAAQRNQNILEYEFDGLMVKEDVELSMRFSTGMQSERLFYSDFGLGWDLQNRRRRHDFPLPFNFVPSSSIFGIHDKKQDANLSLIVSHSLGISSLRDGQIEFFVFRRLTSDDGAGLMEGCDDILPSQMKFWLALDSDKIRLRELSISKNNPLQLVIFPMEIASSPNNFYESVLALDHCLFSPLKASLPKGVFVTRFRIDSFHSLLSKDNTNAEIVLRSVNMNYRKSHELKSELDPLFYGKEDSLALSDRRTCAMNVWNGHPPPFEPTCSVLKNFELANFKSKKTFPDPSLNESKAFYVDSYFHTNRDEAASEDVQIEIYVGNAFYILLVVFFFGIIIAILKTLGISYSLLSMKKELSIPGKND